MPYAEPYAMKVKKTYRLEQGTVDEIGAIADREGVSATVAVERAIAAYGAGADANVAIPSASGDPPSTAVDALAAQLAVKDEQIRTLGDALKAAQALNAASIGRAPALAEGPTEEEARARAEAAAEAERERIRSLPLLRRLLGKF